MLPKLIKEKGILAKLLEKGIRLLLIKECKKISSINIDILSSSTKIIKGEIQKINIIAKDINYKDLLFDEFELEANNIKINFKLKNKQFYFKNDPIVKFKISLSQNSLKTVLSSKSWNWMGNMISEEILNQDNLEDIKIYNCQFVSKASKEHKNINQRAQIEVKTYKGKIHLKNGTSNKTIQIPIEEKVYIENINIEDNLISIFGSSCISF